MKQLLLKFLTPCLIVIMAVVMLSNSGGPGGDNTGSPNDSSQNACTQCHSSFSLNSGTGSVTSNAPSSYYPGNSYSITISVAQSTPAPSRYGFQGVFLNGSNAQAGSLTAGTGTKINSGTIDNITQNSTLNTSGNWTFTWTAPTTSTAVTLYYSGNAANGNGGTSGDHIYTGSDAISALNVITYTSNSSPASCVNICDGTASLSGTTGGAGSPFSYLWSSGATTASVTGLCAGTYTVTVTDGAGNTETSTVIVGQPAPIILSVAANPATCAFGDGDAIVSPSGGTGAFTYLWSNGETTDAVQNLAPGTYTVTVTDGNGCTEVETVIIPSGSSGLQGISSSDPENCDQGNGTANILMITGNLPYSYLWSSGSTNATATGLSEGTFTVTVTDNLGCVETFEAQVSEEFAVIDEPGSVINDAQCFGANNGSIVVNMESGASPFSYAWDTTVTDSGSMVGNLTAGTYSVTVTDSEGCIDMTTFTINEPSEIILSVPTAAPTSAPLACDGEVMATVSGGVPPYDYLWSDPNAQTTETATGLCDPSMVSVLITDDNGCTRLSDSVRVAFPGGFSELATSQLELWPVPALDQLTFATTSGGINTIVIKDLQGRTAGNWTYGSGEKQVQLDVSGLPAGSYVALVDTKSGLAIKTLIIGR